MDCVYVKKGYSAVFFFFYSKGYVDMTRIKVSLKKVQCSGEFNETGISSSKQLTFYSKMVYIRVENVLTNFYRGRLKRRQLMSGKGRTHGTFYKQINGVCMFFPLALHQLMSFQSITKKSGQNVFHSNINHFTIEGTLMVYLFHLIHKNIQNFFRVTSILIMLTYPLLQKMKKTTVLS